jgi:AraC-like DNA-binding protein
MVCGGRAGADVGPGGRRCRAERTCGQDWHHDDVLSSLPAGQLLAPSGPVYRRPPSHRGLASVMTCVWATSVPPSAQSLRVLPDAAVDLVFADGRLVAAGPDTGPVVEQLPEGQVVGFQLAPGAVGTVLHVPASALLDGRVDIAELWGSAGRDLVDRLREADRPDQVRSLVEEAVLHHASSRRVDRLAGRLRSLLSAADRVDGRALGVGDRQLRRRCLAAFGYPPRTLRRIMRFQRFMEQLSTDPRSPLAERAVAAGYVDQSHLSHDVGELTGLTAGALRRAVSHPLAGQWT